MNEMRYEAPKTLEAAVALLAGANGVAKVLAGGTDLLIQMRGGRVEPALLVDVKGIPEMTSIVAENGGFRFGAAVSCMELSEHAAFAKAWPGLTEAAMLIGSYQIKGRATVGGNLCNASPAADSVPALIAAGATASIVGPNGRREAKVADIATGPGQEFIGERGTRRLVPDAAAPGACGRCVSALYPATEMDIAVVGAGVNLTLDAKGVCTQARVCLGAVAERALLVQTAAEALIGTTVDAAALERMGAACSAAAKPIDDKRGTKCTASKFLA